MNTAIAWLKRWVLGRSPLHDAATSGDISRIESLLATGTNIDEKARGNVTALFLAVRHGHDKIAARLLQAGADVNARESHGISPIMLAAGKGLRETVQMLLSHKADLGGQTSEGLGILHEPAARGFAPVVQMLAQHGADVNEADAKQGATPLIFAVVSAIGKAPPEALILESAQTLLNQGANAAARDKQGRTALQHASGTPHEEVVELLIRSGADVNGKANNGSSPLQNAAEHNRATIAELLLVNGANPNISGSVGLTPLHFAAQNGHLEVARVLIAHGADVNARDTDPRGGGTPLFHAVESDTTGTGATLNRAKQMVQLLVDNGADINAKMNSGQTARAYATAHRHPFLAAFIETLGGR